MIDIGQAFTALYHGVLALLSLALVVSAGCGVIVSLACLSIDRSAQRDYEEQMFDPRRPGSD